MDADTLVMTWNVRYFSNGSRGFRASDAWMRRMAWVVAGQPELPAVIALQEVESGSLRGGRLPQLDRFAALLHQAVESQRRDAQYEALYFPAHRYGWGGASLMTTGLGVLVDRRWAIEGTAWTDITHVRLRGAARLKQRRIAARVRIRPPAGEGGAFDLVNTHLSLPAFFEVGPHRVPHAMGDGSNQLAEVGNLLEWLAPAAERPVVVVGDFNSRPGSPAYARLVDGGLVDAYAAHAEPGPEQEPVATAEFLHLRMHIDHLFSTPAVRWTDVRAHSVDRGPFRGLSDHAPKLGRVRAAA